MIFIFSGLALSLLILAVRTLPSHPTNYELAIYYISSISWSFLFVSALFWIASHMRPSDNAIVSFVVSLYQRRQSELAKLAVFFFFVFIFSKQIASFVTLKFLFDVIG